jgi:2-polyprenyl-3-methyl-5-hydroxy-6-metoxy-1,4-benzoquinol methylase
MKPYLKTKDYSVSQEEFELLFNEELDMLVTSPQPKNIASYYDSEDYISHTDSNKTGADKLYQIVKRYSLGKKLRLISRYDRRNKSLLDIGAGTGDFLLTAKRNGWQIDGVEPNSNARMKALEKGLSLLTSMESIPGKKYKVITLWHVLEHLPDLENQIMRLTWHLEEEGTLIIAVPNFKSYDAKFYKEFWAAYDTPRHLWHFSRNSIERLFAKNGLHVIKTKPMIYDAFYVSLLSEKYKSPGKGKMIVWKAFLRGLKSNISAWRTKEYSSLIYVLKKS